MGAGTGTAQLLPNSLTLKLGWEPSLSTTTQIPQPPGIDATSQANQTNNCYNAFVDVPYDHNDFVFTAAGANVNLVDTSSFSVNKPASLPYIVMDIVKCDADQQITYFDEHNKKQTKIIHAAACAQPACQNDPRPAPGSLILSFPNGRIPDIAKLGDILSNTHLSNSPVNLCQSPIDGDFPLSGLSETHCLS